MTSLITFIIIVDINRDYISVIVKQSPKLLDIKRMYYLNSALLTMHIYIHIFFNSNINLKTNNRN